MSPILGIYASQISGHLTPPSSFYNIATVTASGSQSSVTFSSIPSTYKSLQLRILSNDGSGYQNNFVFNSDTGTNYTYHRMLGNGSTVTAVGATGQTSAKAASYNSPDLYNQIYAFSIVDIIDYANTSKYKTIKSQSGFDANGASGPSFVLTSNLWLNTAAITSITITNVGSTNWTSSSTFTLYGIS